MHAYMHTYMRAYMHTYMHVCIHACVHTYRHACMHIHTYIYMHTYMHAYIRTYIDVKLHNKTSPRQPGTWWNLCRASRQPERDRVSLVLVRKELSYFRVMRKQACTMFAQSVHMHGRNCTCSNLSQTSEVILAMVIAIVVVSATYRKTRVQRRSPPPSPGNQWNSRHLEPVTSTL